MNIFGWFRSPFSIRSKALSLYRAGMTKANAHQHQRAIDDYTNSIKLQDAPADVIAMATYNRALVHLAVGDFAKGAEDLNAILQMEEAPANIKKMANKNWLSEKQDLVRLRFENIHTDIPIGRGQEPEAHERGEASTHHCVQQTPLSSALGCRCP